MMRLGIFLPMDKMAKVLPWVRNPAMGQMQDGFEYLFSHLINLFALWLEAVVGVMELMDSLVSRARLVKTGGRLDFFEMQLQGALVVTELQGALVVTELMVVEGVEWRLSS
jgi:hypothetical protein